jgi:glutathione S-transferase
MGEFTLYGSDVSHFTGKVHDYLKYKEVPFSYKLATRQVYEQILVPRTGVKYIPVLLLPDNRIIQDTSNIMDYIEQEFTRTSIYTKDNTLHFIGKLVECFADEWMLLPSMHYRWNFPEYNNDFLFQSFGATMLPDDPPQRQVKAGKGFARFFSGARQPLGIYDRSIPIIEGQAVKFLHLLNCHFSEHDYFLGEEPTLADFSLMGPVFSHLSQDPYPKKLLEKNYPNIIAWINRVHNAKNNVGLLFNASELPATLTSIVSFILSSLQSFLLESLAVIEADLDENKNNYTEEIPRVAGEMEFDLAGLKVKRKAFFYTQWMLVRLLEQYKKLTADEKDTFFNTVGHNDYFNITLKYNLTRKAVLQEGEILPGGSTLLLN